MTKNADLDPLFVDAENLASDFSLFPRSSNPTVPHNIGGLISDRRIRQRLRQLSALGVDDYVHEAVGPVEDQQRPGVRPLLRRLGWRVLRELERGPLYAAEVVVEIGGRRRKLGILAQDRDQSNGVWLPEHHLRAVRVIRELANHLTPVVTLIDTPGADGGAEANSGNQAHSISRLIAEMAQLHVPTVGVIFGNGYSGGAIPLATTNILLSVVDGVFNTIQPRALANIARKYKLSWQECAKAVGVSAYELYDQGYLDGVIDYSPLGGAQGLENFETAILSSVAAVEDLAEHFVSSNDSIHEHYRRTVERYLEPPSRVRAQIESEVLSSLVTPTQQPSVFGVTYRYLRYLGLRKKVSSTTVESYGRLTTSEIPSGDLGERQERENRHAFLRWVENPLKIKYDDLLDDATGNFEHQRAALGRDRGAVAAFFLGSREQNYVSARSNLSLELGFHLYNLWKTGSANNFPLLIDYLEKEGRSGPPTIADPDVLDLALDPDLREVFVEECRDLILFDHVYNELISELRGVAFEAMQTNRMSPESVEGLLQASLEVAMPIAKRSLSGDGHAPTEEELADRLHAWIRRFVRYRRRGELLKSVADWKKASYPAVSEPLFGLITFFFDRLLPSYYDAEAGGRYDGRIRPRNIGIKDFWNRLDRAYKDLLIEEVLTDIKQREKITPQRIFESFFLDAVELDRTLMTSDPVHFPGFRIAIEQALERGLVPCGTVTGFAGFEFDGKRHHVGVLASNLAFQAGSFDMASGVKLCRLLTRCAQRRLPVVCFISSGGMQTKEGAGSLFSMAIVNDRITRFVRENDLPVLMFGFGDCTGGAQASMVTHPLVDTFYFSGSSMPFAGQIVVQSHLPRTSTLSNYLVAVPGSMQGLVKHPFATDLDKRLWEIDNSIPLPDLTVAQVIANVLEGRAPKSETVERPRRRRSRKLYRPLERTLIHARGCTAVKLVDRAQHHGLQVVLVQSDPDMESAAAARLRDDDTLVCLGGSTPDESYLNAHSVIRIAETEDCDSLHPGIGFLSESSAFADLCSRHDLNFIGPSTPSMERMGNKSNAVQTAAKLDIPVVPGSHGVVSSPESAVEIAQSVGYPIVLKAVHGGGGRGIEIVHRREGLEDTFLRMAQEAQSAFGSRDLYIEKFIERFRHVEIQVLRDRHGSTKVLGMRDCSVQRNQQKVIEESGSDLLSTELREAAYRHARVLADEVDYVGAGTVEFIHDLDRGAIYFMEMNARLQVEHPVTEAVTGVDIVGEQFRIAAGGSIAELSIEETGYSIELRLNAERISHDKEGALRILPDPGRIDRFELPPTPGVEVLAAVDDGSVISPFYDNLIAQIIAHGATRNDVIKTLLEFLDGARIEGVGTNAPLLVRILHDDEFRDGRHDTGYIGRLFERLDMKSLIEEVDARRGGRGGSLDRSSIEIEDSDELKVIATSPGIFFSAPAPGRPDFVQPGDRVRNDTTLCLLEAMKLFEEISLATFNGFEEIYPPSLDYEIVRVNAHEGQLITEGDLLFVVRPAGRTADAA